MQKKFLFGILGAVPRSSILNNFGQSRIRKEHVYLFAYQLKRRKRRKRVDLKNHCETFRDNNHQHLYKNTKLYNDIDWNPGPVYMNELPL